MDEYDEGKDVTARVTREQGLFLYNHGFKSASSYPQSAFNTDEDFSLALVRLYTAEPHFRTRCELRITQRISGNSVNKGTGEVEKSGTVWVWSS